MAYVFNTLDQGLQPSNTNIFAQAAPGAGQAASGQTGQEPQRNVDAGSVGGSTGSASGPGASTPASVGKFSNVDQSQVLSKQGMNLATPSFVSGIQDKLGQAQGQQAQEAQTYLGGVGNYGLDAGTLQKAQTGDTAAYNQVASRLSQAAPQAGAFKSNVDLSGLQSQVGQLGSPAQLQGYLQSQQKGNANYTPGMSALDQMLLAQNQGFKDATTQLTSQEKALEANRAQEEQSLQNQLQGNINTAYGKSTQDIRDALGGSESTILKGVDARVAAENNKRQVLRAQPQNFFDQDQAAAAQKELLAKSPELAAYIDRASSATPSSQYYTVGGDVGRSDVATQDEVNQYSALQRLLKDGGPELSASAGLSPAVQFNKGAYQNALEGAARPQATAGQAQAAAAAQAAASAQSAQDKQAADAANAAQHPIGNYIIGTALPSVKETGQQVAGAANSALNAILHPSVQTAQEAIHQGASSFMPVTPIPGMHQLPSPTFSPNVGGGMSGMDRLEASLYSMPSFASSGGGGGGPQIGGSLGQLANSAKSYFSDVRAKTNIANPSSHQVQNFMSHLSPKTYSYKPGLGLPPGPQMGVMAQDIQKSPLGAQAVGKDPATGLKTVDYTKLFPALTASLADHDERIRAIEAQKKKKAMGV